MSCLSKNNRISNNREFQEIYKKGKRWHCPSFVSHFKASNKLGLAFVASKKIGSAVVRNKIKRRLRAICLEKSKTSGLKIGRYVFVAKQEIAAKSYDELKKDMNWSLKKLHDEKNSTPSN